MPIVLREFKGRPVLLYNKATRAENPLRCVEFENTTGLTLEGGPVTVLEGGSYVGEAMLETLKPDETRLVPFAVELGVKVLDNVASQDEHVSRVVVHNGTLQTRHGQVKSTTYAFDNKGDAPAVVYLEHRREDSDWKLVEPPTAHEITESFWRFRFDLAAHGVTQFRVRTQRLIVPAPCSGRHFDQAARALDRSARPRRANRRGHSQGHRPAAATGRGRGEGTPAGGRAQDHPYRAGASS